MTVYVVTDGAVETSTHLTVAGDKQEAKFKVQESVVGDPKYITVHGTLEELKQKTEDADDQTLLYEIP